MNNSDQNTWECFHCGQPVPAGTHYFTLVSGESRAMCCHGCLAAAETIVACGLDRFYQVRTGEGPRPDTESGVDTATRFAAFDDAGLQSRFVAELPDGGLEAALLLDGISCAACCWLIEQRLAALPGVRRVNVNYAARTATVQWDPARVRLSAILAAISRLGYHASPYDAAAADRQLARGRNAQLRRIGITGLFGMQVMMLSLGLYLGADAGIDPGLAPLLRWCAGVLVLPILVYGAAPFFRGALRDLRAHTLGMDVPVALGIGIAFLGSLHALATGRGDIYFDSIAMFVFILLCGRFVEFTVRRRAAAQWDRLQRIQPAVATRLRAGDDGSGTGEVVPVTALAVGDLVLVRPGETMPADGVVMRGTSSVNESLLTGESRPVRRNEGDPVVGGSINIESPLCVQVTRISSESRLAQIARLARDAGREKPAARSFASRVASHFIARLLLIAAGVALFWWWRDAERWIPITVSVLVITCPCALALAAPAALAAATGSMLRLGLLVRRTGAMETLGRATLFVFDKTGTLTSGELHLTEVRSGVPHVDAGQALALAAALEAGSEHPVGRALRGANRGPSPVATNIRATPGAGVEGEIAGVHHVIGTAAFVAQRLATSRLNAPASPAGSAATEVVLANPDSVVAVFLLQDAVRDGADELVAHIAKAGGTVRVLSGDTDAAVAAVAAALGVDAAEGGLLPARKVERLTAWRGDGEVICMTGDGVNDAPVLAAADVSVAMGSGADLARASADIILLEGRLPVLRAGIDLARRTLAIMGQNVAWAIGYNIVAVPLAAVGLVTPWLAALGMSLSSLLVVLNAARLGRVPGREA